MKRRKRKPGKPIPNAEAIARSLGAMPATASAAQKVHVPKQADGTENNAYTLTVRIDEAPSKEAEAMERGRTLGRLEILAERFACYLDDEGEYRRITLGMDSVRAIAPVLSAECERLRSEKP